MNPYVVISLKNLRMGDANYYMLIDNAHIFLSGHSLVHLLTPKCPFPLRQDVYILQILNALCGFWVD